MRGFALSLLVVAFASGGVFAGTVSFDPDKAGVLPGEDAIFQVSISSADTQGFNNLGILLGSRENLPMSFEFDPDWVLTTTAPPQPAQSFGVYAAVGGDDLFVGGNKDDATGWNAPILVGTLTVDTTGLVEGDTRLILVDPDFETQIAGFALSNVNGAESLSGVGTINIVPEPATLVLLGLGGIVALRRRRAAL